MKEPAIRVEVAYAQPGRGFLRKLDLAAGSSVAEAIEAWLAECPGIDLRHCRVGIYGRLVRLDRLLRDGDRVEIYRPLLVDPKQARRLRAAARKRPA